MQRSKGEIIAMAKDKTASNLMRQHRPSERRLGPEFRKRGMQTRSGLRDLLEADGLRLQERRTAFIRLGEQHIGKQPIGAPDVACEIIQRDAADRFLDQSPGFNPPVRNVHQVTSKCALRLPDQQWRFRLSRRINGFAVPRLGIACSCGDSRKL